MPLTVILMKPLENLKGKCVQMLQLDTAFLSHPKCLGTTSFILHCFLMFLNLEKHLKNIAFTDLDDLFPETGA